MSDSGTSSLSELEEEILGTTGESNRDGDSEAETEQLEPSPAKLRQAASGSPQAIRGDKNAASTKKHSMMDSDEDDIVDSTTAEEGVTNGIVDNASHIPRRGHRSFAPEQKMPTPKDLAGTKRKRNTSALADQYDSDTKTAPPKKRASSSRTDNSRRAEFHRRSRSSHGGIEEIQDDHALKSSDEEEIEQPDGVAVTNNLDVPPDEAEGRLSSNEEVEGSDAPSPEQEDDVEDDEQAVEMGAENEAVTRDNVDDDETEATAKNEDEVAKKQLALEELKPIERMFAILRDRIFDDRFAALSEELDLLNPSNPTHPDFLAMRQTLDARRDEKIQHEKILLGFNLELAKNNAIGKHHQSHSQYAQMVRETREKNLGELNSLFCGIKHELREWDPKEPHLTYQFETRRSQQIAQQISHNKEVSILSGLARFVGFPAAPDMHQASSADIESDFRNMKLKLPVAAPLAKMANAVNMESLVAEEQFIESTPWANPRHPVVQQVLTRERQDSAQPSRRQHTDDSQPFLVGIQGPDEVTSSPFNHLPSTASHTTPSNQLNSLQQFSREEDPISSEPLSREWNVERNMKTKVKAERKNAHPSADDDASKYKDPHMQALPYDVTAVQQPYQTSALHSHTVNELLATAPVGSQSGYGTPGPSLLARADTQDHFNRRTHEEAAAFPFPAHETPFSGAPQRISIDNIGGR